MASSSRPHALVLRERDRRVDRSGIVRAQIFAFGVGPDSIFTIDASGVIARGLAKDVLAEGLCATQTPGTGARIVVNLDHSSPKTATVTDEGGGTATVTMPLGNEHRGAATSHRGRISSAAGSPIVDARPGKLPGKKDIDGEPDDGGADIGATCLRSLARNRHPHLRQPLPAPRKSRRVDSSQDPDKAPPVEQSAGRAGHVLLCL